MNTFATLPQTLSSAQVFEALSKSIGIEFAEANTEDWTAVTKSSNISISDICSGFLKFRFSNKYESHTAFAQKSNQYFSAFLTLDGDGNERYRIGHEDQNPSVYVLKANKEQTLPENANPQWRSILGGFEFYREQNGTLIAVSPSEKILAHLYKARLAKKNHEKYDRKKKSGYYKNMQKKIKGSTRWVNG